MTAPWFLSPHGMLRKGRGNNASNRPVSIRTCALEATEMTYKVAILSGGFNLGKPLHREHQLATRMTARKIFNLI